MPPEPQPVDNGGLIVKTASQPVGSAARLAAALVHVLRLPAIVVAHDGSPPSAYCADLFARHAIHGGYAEGHTWQKVDAMTVGPADHTDFTSALATLQHHGVWFSSADDGVVTCRVHDRNGTPLAEEALAPVLRRIADNSIPLPVNAKSIGTVTRGPDLGAATSGPNT